MAEYKKSDSARKFALYSGVAAVLAFFACNGLALFAIIGITLAINPDIQAGLISVFAILTLALVYKGFRLHRKKGPLLLAGSGALVIILTMYVSYSKPVESAGLLMLVIAAGWSWYIAGRQRC